MLGNQRRPDESCAPNPSPVDPGEARSWTVRHAAGSTVVPAEPQKIVVLSGDQLDALCALGLQSRIVAAALPDGSDSQPSYLGTVVHDLPAVGTRSEPDLEAIRAAEPDLILGSEALTPDAYPELSAIAPTVFTGAAGRGLGGQPAHGRRGDLAGRRRQRVDRRLHRGRGQDRRRQRRRALPGVGRAVHRHHHAGIRARQLPRQRAGRLSAWIALRHNALPISRMIEVGTTEEDLDNSPDFSIADGDIVYVSFASPAAKDRAGDVMGSDAWKKLSANKDNRVFVVNNEVWQTGEGIVAARGMLVGPALGQRPDQLTSTGCSTS